MLDNDYDYDNDNDNEPPRDFCTAPLGRPLHHLARPRTPAFVAEDDLIVPPRPVKQIGQLVCSGYTPNRTVKAILQTRTERPGLGLLN
jgi:hypothetical protein